MNTAGRNSSEDLRRDLCARILQEPKRFDAAARLVDAALLRTQLHTHPDLIQLDVVLHCAGGVHCNSEPEPVKSISAFAFYPNAPHSHELRIVNFESEVLTLKLGVDPEWPAIKHETFAPICHTPVQAPALIRAFRRLAWLSVTGRNHSLASLTALVELISLWPDSNGQPEQASIGFEISTRLDPVLKLIDRSPNAPPDIRAMARAASLSPRQLMRQFAAHLGCTPHEYVTRQRLSRARDLLASARMNVTEVAEALGFATIHSFSRWFQKGTGMNPSDFRNKLSKL